MLFASAILHYQNYYYYSRGERTPFGTVTTNPWTQGCKLLLLQLASNQSRPTV